MRRESHDIFMSGVKQENPFGHIRAERPPVRHIVAAFFNQMDLLGHLETHISTPA